MGFLNCLRIQIVPNHFEDERIENIVNYCKIYDFKNVMLFINAEEYNVGHMTIEEARPWVETMKKAKKVLNKNGISVSLNPWIELGQIDRSRPLKNNQDFTTMVDFDGNKSEMSVCPLCDNWRKYFSEFYTYLLKEVQPEVVWVEDDFRLHNHQPLKYGGCFCDIHLGKINEKLNKNLCRYEIKERLFNGDEEVRNAWLEVNRFTMLDTADFIGKIVKKVCNAKVGLMSSAHVNHAMEERDWCGVHNAFAQGGTQIDRLHLPCYDEISPKVYYYNFNVISYICRGFLPDECEVYPELENGSFSTFTKDSRFLQFQLESAIPLCIKGMTYDIYDFVGNGTISSFGYGEVVKKIKPYLDSVTDLNLKFSQLEGIICPIDEKSVRNRKNIHSFVDLYPDEHNFYAYLSAVGLNIKVSKEKAFLNKTIALSNGAIFNFTDEEILNLFNSNYIILEGGAVVNLIDRGLGYLIGAESYKIEKANGINSYEQVNGNLKINRIKGYRASALGKAGDYVNISYYENTCALTSIFDYKNNFIGNGIAANKNYYIIPFIIKGISFSNGLVFENNVLLEQFNDLRTFFLRDYLIANTSIIVSTGYLGVYSYLYNQDDKKVLVLVNSTLNDFNNEILIKGVPINNIERISRTNCKLEKIEFLKSEGKTSFKLKIKHMTTCCLLLK